jgi:hypothetical protein
MPCGSRRSLFLLAAGPLVGAATAEEDPHLTPAGEAPVEVEIEVADAIRHGRAGHAH